MPRAGTDLRAVREARARMHRRTCAEGISDSERLRRRLELEHFSSRVWRLEGRVRRGA